MKIILLFILAFSFVSCGQKKVKTDFTVDFSSLASALSVDQFQGGLILYGTSHTGDSFTRILDGASFSSEIPEAIWDFRVLAWDGVQSGSPDSANFSGTTACGSHLDVNLKDRDQDVHINIDIGNCQDMFPSIFSSQFDSLLVPKTTGPSAAEPCDLHSGSNCQALTSFSVKVVVREFNRFGGATHLLDKKLLSECFDGDGFNAEGSAAAAINFPLLNLPGHHSVGAIELHVGTRCSGANSNEFRTRVIGKDKILQDSGQANEFNILF